MDDDFRSRLNQVVSRYPTLLLILGWLLGAMILGAWAGSGNLKRVILIIAAGGAATLVMWLRTRYWLLIPLGFSFQLQVIPVGYRTIELPEVLICISAAAFLASYALKIQPFTFFRSSHVPVMLYISWAAMIFILHPVGLAQAGSTVGGARYYAKLLMAFAAFLIMANQTITNRDCWWIIAMIVIGSFFYASQNVFLFFFGHEYGGEAQAAIVDPDSYYTWQQNLVIVPLVVVPMLFARYKGSEMFSLKRPWVLVVLLLCVLTTLLSGKRSGIISIPIYACGAALIRKEWGFLMLWVGSALVAMGLIIIVQGNLFTLPLTIQRTLSWLPAKWDSQLAVYAEGSDPFRDRMNELALNRIKRDPLIGRGYEVDLNMVNQAMGVEQNYLESLCLAMAIGSQWHNSWLGTAADFGIPAAVFQAVLYIQMILLGLWLIKRLPAASGWQTLAFYVLLYTIRDVASSWYGGQSATSPFNSYWMYGMLVAFAVMVQKKTWKQNPVEEITTPQILSPKLLAPHVLGTAGRNVP